MFTYVELDEGAGPARASAPTAVEVEVEVEAEALEGEASEADAVLRSVCLEDGLRQLLEEAGADLCYERPGLAGWEREVAAEAAGLYEAEGGVQSRGADAVSEPQLESGSELAEDGGGGAPLPGAVMDAAAQRLRTVPGSPLAAAVTRVLDAQAQLGAVDWSAEHVEVVGDALLALQRGRTRDDVALLAGLGAFDRAEGAVRDGATGTASWLALRSNLTYGQARDWTVAARRLGELPLFARALAAGDVGAAHLLTITRAMVGGRAAAIRACEAGLLEVVVTEAALAPLRYALRRLADQCDPDGSTHGPDATAAGDDAGAGPGWHPERGLHHSRSFDGLGLLDATLDPLVREQLDVALDAFNQPDPPDTPVERLRTPAQRRHDAFAAMLGAVLGLPGLPTVHGARPHVLIVVELFELLGLDPRDPTARQVVGALLRQAGIDLPGLTDLLAEFDPEELADVDEDDIVWGREGTGPQEGTEDDSVRDGDTDLRKDADRGAAHRDAAPTGDESDPLDGQGTGKAAPTWHDTERGQPHGAAAGGDPDARVAAARAQEARTVGGAGTPASAGEGPQTAAPAPPPTGERARSGTGLQRPARYGSGVPLPLSHVRQLMGDALVSAVLTLGPWRPVNVGAAHRTLPPWLRAVLHAMHQHCRGPSCTRRFAWTQAAHNKRSWHAGRTTDLNDTLPLCLHCHKLLDERGWRVDLDPVTGRCTWISPDGRTFTNHPPR